MIHAQTMPNCYVWKGYPPSSPKPLHVVFAKFKLVDFLWQQGTFVKPSFVRFVHQGASFPRRNTANKAATGHLCSRSSILSI